MADVVDARPGIRRTRPADEQHQDGSGARRRPGYDHGERHHGTGYFARRNAHGHGAGCRPHPDDPPNQGLHAGGRFRYDRRPGFLLRYVYHQAQGLGRATGQGGCGERRNRPDIQTHGRHQGCTDFRRGTADDLGLRYLDRFHYEPSGQVGRQPDGLLQHLPAVHRGAEPAPGDRTRLLDLQHQLPAVHREHRRGKGQTGRHLAQRDPFDAFGLLRRAVRLERQPVLEDVLRDDPVRPEIPSRHRIAQQRLRTLQQRRDGSPGTVCESGKGLQLRGAEPLQHVQFDRRERHGGRRVFVG